MQKKQNAVLKRELKRAMDRKEKQALARRKKALKLKRAKQKVMAIAAKVRLRAAKAAERRKLAKATVAEQARVLEKSWPRSRTPTRRKTWAIPTKTECSRNTSTRAWEH